MTACIYICSAGHSGSTLLDLLLGSHSDVESLGEINQFPKNVSLDTVCTCGSKVSECGFWRSVVSLLDERLGTHIWNDPYSLNLGYHKAKIVVDRKHQTPLYNIERKVVLGLKYFELLKGVCIPGFLTRKFDEGISNLYALYEAVGDINGKHYVVDSSKSYLNAASLFSRYPEGTRIILLVRDGRAVLNSGLKNGFSREQSIKAWMNTYTRSAPLFDRLQAGSAILSVQYESLATHVEAELRRICGFIGLDYEPEMLEYASKTQHSTNGNDMRLQKRAEIKLDESWRTMLTEADLSYFEQHAGEYNRSMGYT